MTERPVVHDTFVIERAYPADLSRVFACFSSQEAKDTWGDTGDLAAPGPDDSATEFDFRPGGHERFGFGYQGVSFRYDGFFYDIVPDERIIYSYEMYADGARISVSVATIEFAATSGGTTLTWTEQGAYLSGADGAEGPRLRAEGTAEMLDGLAKYLAGDEPPGTKDTSTPCAR